MNKGSEAANPIGKLLGLRYKSHPWHGVNLGNNAPQELTCFIEMVPTDTVKYEVDKVSGYLMVDRPQKYSNILPALYGFIPQTFCDERVAQLTMKALGRENIVGDNDPLDVCVLTEKEIAHGDILVQAIPVGGFRMIDGEEADDKIVAVLKGDALYGEITCITQLPEAVVNRLKHYFLTYKDMPAPGELGRVEIPEVYKREQALEVIQRAMDDYQEYIKHLLFGKFD
jgi:inorganic pyrophosphatase